MSEFAYSIDLETVSLFSPATLQNTVGLVPGTTFLLLLLIGSQWTEKTQQVVQQLTDFCATHASAKVLVSIAEIAGDSIFPGTRAELIRLASPFLVIRNQIFPANELPAVYVLDWLGGRRLGSGIEQSLAPQLPRVLTVCEPVVLDGLDASAFRRWQNRCNFLYLHVRDLLFQTRNQLHSDGQRGWQKVLTNLHIIQEAYCASRRASMGRSEAVANINTWAQNILLSSELEHADCSFFKAFLEYLDEVVGKSGGVNRLFPKRAQQITLLYRSRKWEMLREGPVTWDTLWKLVHDQIPDINVKIARVFTPAGVVTPDFVPDIDKRLVLLLLDQHNQLNQVEPLERTDAEIHADMVSIRSKISREEETLQFHTNFVINAAQVIRFIERKVEQDLAIGLVPVFEMHETALERIRAGQARSYEEALLSSLADWFANEYYSLLPSSIVCDECKSDVGMRTMGYNPTQYLWYCDLCNTKLRDEIRTIDDVGTLLKQKSGQPTDFAKAFALVARAMGFEVRIVIAGFADSAPQRWWNEVFLNKEWVHVDVSGGVKSGKPPIRRPFTESSSSGATMRSSRALVNDPESIGRMGELWLAVAVGNSGLAVVTRRYLNSREALELANDNRPEADMNWCMNVFHEAFIASDPRESTVSRYLHHVAETERIWLECRFPSTETDQLQMGQWESFIAPRISGSVYAPWGEAPGWRMKKPEHRFTYGPDMRVASVETCWTPMEGKEVLTRIKFFYYGDVPVVIQPRIDDEERSSFSSQTRSVSFGSEASDTLPVHTRCKTEIELGDDEYISVLRPQKEMLGSMVVITGIHIEKMGENRVVGIYGSRDSATLAVDFLGIYELQDMSVGLGRTPPITSFMRADHH